jgi:hypothetical protein
MPQNHLTTAWVKLQYTFILELDYPLVNSVAAVAKFLLERRIQIESISVGPGDKNNLSMVLKCHLEKDRLQHTMDLLSIVIGVLKLELLIPNGRI